MASAIADAMFARIQLVAVQVLLLGSCARDEHEARERVLTIGAYTAPREVLAALVPQFAAEWRAKTGESVRVDESYLGSGAQARAIANGFEADVALLSLEPDVDVLRRAGLVHGASSIVSRSRVVIGVRASNPKHVATFADLARADVDVVTPDVKMSGGAMWNVAALLASVPADEREAFLAKVLGRVKVFDKGARESMLTFETGAGDAIVTYENEIAAAKAAGKSIDEIVPPSTILIENPAVVVDVYANKHENVDVANAFVAFLASDAAQTAFAAHGYLASIPANAHPIASIGGWPKLETDVFAPNALYDRALAQARR